MDQLFNEVLDFVIELGWYSAWGLGPKQDKMPSESVQSTAWRCYRILVGVTVLPLHVHMQA